MIAPTATVIRSLLDGHSPNGVTPAECIGFEDVIAALCDAHAAGGTEAVRKVFNTLSRTRPELIQIAAGEPDNAKRSYTMAELYAAEFSEPKFAVPGILPYGITTLAGRPKLGKSWLLLQTAHAVGTGGMLFGQEVEKGKVLYLALEDNWRRLKDRAAKQEIPASADITYRTEWEYLTGNGLPDLMHEVSINRYTLVIVDTLSRAIGKADQMDNGEMNVLMGSLQRLTQTFDIALLLSDHHRKSATGGFADPIDDVMGSTAKAGVMDAVLGLYRGRGQKDATLKLTGRDIEEKEMIIRWDAHLFCWQLVGDADGVRADTLQAEILQAMKDTFGDSATTGDLARHLGKQASEISRALSGLLEKGIVRRGQKKGREVIYEVIYR